MRAGAADLEHRGVGQRVERGLGEGLQEHGLDQRLGGLPAGAVRHRDLVVPQLGPAGALLLDDLQHALLAFARARVHPRAPSHHLPLAREAAVGVVGGARALGRDHAGADRVLGRAGRAEDLALQGLITPFSTSPHWHALGSATRTWAREAVSASKRPYASERRSALCEMKPRPRHSKCGRNSKTSAIAAGRGLPSRHDARVLVLDLAAPLGELPQDHLHRLQQVERLEARDHERLAVVARDELERARANEVETWPGPMKPSSCRSGEVMARV